MSDTLLQKAIDCLKIQDVFQRSVSANITEGFDPKYLRENLQSQFKHIVTKSQVININDDNEDICLFHVYIDLGVRWMPASLDLEEANDDESNEPSIMAFIEATFVAEYSLDGEPGKEALDAFALKNASYHIWPYWREFLMSQCMRMNLPKISLPAVQFAVNKDESSSED
ncbi:MAG: preprotein translocase subunit SecB [Thiotrichaceae bacterium]